MRQILSVAALLLTGCLNLPAQIEIPADFEALLQKTGVEIFFPLESTYRNWGSGENEWLNCEFAIRSRKEKIEIRYHLQPYLDSDPTADLPHLNCMRLLTHLASNDEDAVIAAHVLSDTDLEDYRADWGKLYFFRPKRSFGDYANCQLLALYREGVGMACVFYFFDEPSVNLEDRLREIRFAAPLKQR